MDFPERRTFFLSHYGKDTKELLARPLFLSLSGKGFNCFLDESSVELSSTSKDTLTRAIKESKFFVAILSENYYDSEWCMWELDLAKKENKIVIPIYYDHPPKLSKLPGPHFVGIVKKPQDNLSQFIELCINKLELKVRVEQEKMVEEMLEGDHSIALSIKGKHLRTLNIASKMCDKIQIDDILENLSAILFERHSDLAKKKIDSTLIAKFTSTRQQFKVSYGKLTPLCCGGLIENTHDNFDSKHSLTYELLHTLYLPLHYIKHRVRDKEIINSGLAYSNSEHKYSVSVSGNSNTLNPGNLVSITPSRDTLPRPRGMHSMLHNPRESVPDTIEDD